MKFYWLILLITFLLSISVKAQNSFQLGQRLKVGNQKLDLVGFDRCYESYPALYDINIDYVFPATETVFKISSLKLKDTTKVKFGYSIDVAYMFSKEVIKMKMVYNKYETNYPPPTKLIKDIRSISITNNLDFHYRISDKFIFTNSLGFYFSGWFIKHHKGSYFFIEDEETPSAVIKLTYSPQLIVNYDKFSLNFHLIQDIVRINKFYKSLYNTFSVISPNVYFTTYTGIGLLFIPHIKKRKVMNNNPD